MRRKRKKNKYNQFSKVNTEKDPLDLLIEESEEKIQQLNKETKSKRSSKSAQQQALIIDIAPLPKVEFPDNKDIDPYDPTTFGYIEIASVIGAHGVHGWVKVKCMTDFPAERLCTPGCIRHLKPPNKRAPRQMIVLQGKQKFEDEYLIQFQGVMDRDAAQQLRGSRLYLRQEQKDDKAPEDPDEYLVTDLVGMEVFLSNGDNENDNNNESNKKKFVGSVGGVVFSEDLCYVPGLGHDYLEIVLLRGIGGTVSLRDEMVLIPLVPAIVQEVDLQERCIYIDPPSGLLDLTYVREEKSRIKGFLPKPNTG